jgi:hypothetical protein
VPVADLPDPLDDLGQVGVLHGEVDRLGQEEADGADALGYKGASNGVGHITEFLGNGQHSLARLGRNLLWFIEGEGDGRLGHSRALSDVFYCDSRHEV